eukprot:16084-Heterococcus_DN1.PRE.2
MIKTLHHDSGVTHKSMSSDNSLYCCKQRCLPEALSYSSCASVADAVVSKLQALHKRTAAQRITQTACTNGAYSIV